MEPAISDYDGAWKTALNAFFPAFLALFFPQAHSNIDWTQPLVFLETELQQSAPTQNTGKQRVDTLVQVARTDGSPAQVLVHVEVQSQPDNRLAERMFRYHGRIFDRDQIPVVSLVVLADDSPSFRPDRFGYAIWGCEAFLHFPTVKLRDLDRAALETEENVFALITLLHRDAQETQGLTAERLTRKLTRWRQVLRRGYAVETVRLLIQVMERLLRLPSALQISSVAQLRAIEVEETGMDTFITSIEELGREEGQRDLLTILLEAKLGPLPPSLHTRLRNLEAARLRPLALALLGFTTLDDLTAWLDQPSIA